MTLRSGFLRSALVEHLEYDAVFFRRAVAAAGVAVGRALWYRRNKAFAFKMLSRVHRSGASLTSARQVEQLLREANQRESAGQRTGLRDFYRDHIRSSVNNVQAASTIADPSMLLGYRALVIKRATAGERGVLVLDYSYVFPLFAALFDLAAIAERYYIVLEPSWRGLCTADILSYSILDSPVFVQTVEPRDTAFLESISANFIPVPTAANWWIDHRLVKPDPRVRRDIDVIMTAAWSSIKRHWRFFRVLQTLRDRGHKLRVALVGYSLDMSRGEVEEAARHFGVADQIEFHEALPLPDVVRLLARSKVQVLWSRKEGANRAIIEALFADVPVIVRDGLSYGYRYPYINSQTGRFATESALADTLLEVINHPDRFEPRRWAMANMSCQRATSVLEASIQKRALADGQPWTSPLVVKTVQLETQRYWNPEDRGQFDADYTFLQSQIRRF